MGLSDLWSCQRCGHTAIMSLDVCNVCKTNKRDVAFLQEHVGQKVFFPAGFFAIGNAKNLRKVIIGGTGGKEITLSRMQKPTTELRGTLERLEGKGKDATAYIRLESGELMTISNPRMAPAFVDSMGASPLHCSRKRKSPGAPIQTAPPCATPRPLDSSTRKDIIKYIETLRRDVDDTFAKMVRRLSE